MMNTACEQPNHAKAAGAARRGFSLVELLVATAILSVLMSGIVMLFVGSMRSVSQAHQAFDAFEVARGAMNVIERDLTSAFASREYGDYYTFYGTPIGMIFVGVMGKQDSSVNINLSRVTYVLHVFEDSDFSNRALGDKFETDIWDEGSGDDVTVIVKTRALLRYVEPNVQDLESFPYDWPDLAGSAPGEIGSPERNVWDALQLAVNRNGGIDLYDLGPPEAALADELLKAKKRELWIRMLAGDPTLPDIWALLGEDPRDYVIAEHIAGDIVHADSGIPVGVRDVSNEDTILFPGAFHCFRYGRTNRYEVSDERYELFSDYAVSNFFNDERNLPLYDENAPGANDILHTFFSDVDSRDDMRDYWRHYNAAPSTPGDFLRPRLPEVVQIKFRLMLERPYPGAKDFNRGFSMVIDVPAGFTRSRGAAF